MADAPLQASTTQLRAGDVIETFRALCIETGGFFETACAAAAIQRFASIELPPPPRPDGLTVEAEGRFGKPGYIFTAMRAVVDIAGRPPHRVHECGLFARSASYQALLAELEAEIGEPTTRSPTPGVEFVFIGDPTRTACLASSGEGAARFERGEGDLVTIRAWDVREEPDQPGDAVALVYQRRIL